MKNPFLFYILYAKIKKKHYFLIIYRLCLSIFNSYFGKFMLSQHKKQEIPYSNKNSSKNSIFKNKQKQTETRTF